MAMDIGTAVAYLELDLTAFNTGIEMATGVVESFTNTIRGETQSLGDIFTQVGTGAEVLGNSLTRSLTVPLVDFGQSAIDAYRDYETAFTGIKKTLSVTKEAMDEYGASTDNLNNIYAEIDKAIQKLATSTASSAEEIAGVMEVAGQLGVEFGVAGEGLIDFTEVMIKLGDTTNLSAEEAATALAKFMNVTGTAMEDVDRLGAVIVDLGNNFATDEASIVRMSTRLASAGSIAGLTERDILALSTAMSSVGIAAENGGSSMSQTLTQIEKIVQKAIGGDEGAIVQLETLGRISGMTAEEFSNAWMNDPMTALTNFLYGLGDLEEQGESSVLVLDELGMSGIRQSNMLKALSLASEVLSKAVDTANGAWDENIALSKEAEQRYGTLDSQMSQLNEEWKAMQRDIAELLLPILRDLVDMLKGLIEWWNGLSDGTKKAIVTIGEVVVAVGPALMVFGKLFSAIGLIIGVFEKMNTITPTVAQYLGLVGAGLIDTEGKATSFGSKISSLISTIGGLISSFASTVGSLLVSLGNTIASVVSTVIGFIGNIISSIGSLLATIAPIATVVGGVIMAVVGFLDMLTNGCSLANEALLALGLAIAAIGATMLGVPGIIAGVVAAIVFAIANIIANWDKLVEIFKIGWEIFKEGIKFIWDAITELALNFAKWVIEMTASILGFLKDILGNIVEFFANILKSAAEFALNVGKSAVEFFANIIKSVGEFISNVIKAVFDFFADMASAAVNFFKDVIEAFVNFFKNIFTEGGDFFTRVLKATVELVGDLFKAVGEFFGNILKALVDFIKDFIAGAVKFFADVISKVGDFIKDVIDWFKKLPGEIFQAAKDMVTGFINGIVEFGSKAIEKVKEWAGNIIDKVKSVFGIHSPSTVFKEVASNVVTGFTNEIDAKKSQTENTMGKLAESAFSSFMNKGKAIMDKVSPMVKSTLDSMKNVLSASTSIMTNAGSSLFSGLWNGMKSVWNNISSWISNVTSSMLSKIKNVVSSGKSISGSHASGLDYVPFDGYVAQLHEGERVLTKQEAKQYDSGEAGGGGGDVFNFYNTKPDPREYARQMKRVKRELQYS